MVPVWYCYVFPAHWSLALVLWRSTIRHFAVALAAVLFPGLLAAQSLKPSLSDLAAPHDYVQQRSSSYDRSGGNADARPVPPGESVTLMDTDGPGQITHVWITIASKETQHLKKLVLSMSWDGEASPSVEVPVGDFFGLGLGQYTLYQSIPLSVGRDKALNCFFPMPFQKHARITVRNEGAQKVDALYWNIDYRKYSAPLPAGTRYFHAQFHQATPNTAKVGNKINLDGDGNYPWLSATGEGHFVGVTMSVLENADGWWGEGDDMFFVDGEKLPSINGTGSEDYFLGAWDFGGGQRFAYDLYGAPVAGPEKKGTGWSMYRFHLDSPITFTKSLRAGIEHGHANDRGDNFYSVAYWYQTEPHALLPQLPPVQERLLPEGMPVNTP